MMPGAAVTTPRQDVHYLVLEHGVALLRGKSVPERPQAIIGLAHPKFRDWLTAEAKKLGYC